MSWPLICACLWALAATAVAMLPMRAQYAPGLALLIAAPLLLVWIGSVHGWIAVGLCTVALVSMFRNPLRHMARWAMRRAAGE
ncbi:hypothetical protein PARPLA_02244 [Rhodobacteraceae bacterium THAF1]|uniref:DUF2484 family protein n=1 Tax=Palleronia sp. THAF1 TaxID=2587842 RepID=UPI000F3E7D67|nr:DUF2484 family protein [Palleronia sp. THAF1]QFU09280.1 hypothetical protein FIU81_11400 [Palleronia sp. THAF1]VDC26601.1 hypothetical protein PARPLA_02244 [Rhodobacteraceae bacterium THAF1]